MPTIGNFFWNELNTSDPEQAMAFYGDQIGWAFEASPTEEGGEYWLAKLDGEYVAGINPLASPPYDAKQDFWLPYLSVDDVDARVERAVAAGAKIIRPLWDIPETGRRVVLREPSGLLVAWMGPLG